MGLAGAYRLTEDPNMLAAIQKTKTFLLSKTDSFAGTDGALAVELDGILGGTTCADYVRTNFYDKLEAGTYYDAISDAVHDTNSYVQAQRERRFNEGWANLAAWDLGLGLHSAHIIGANTTDWAAGVKAEIDELNGNDLYDVLGLAGAVFGLAAAGEDHDPNGGHHVAASSLSDLVETLASYQLETGGFTWWWATNEEYLDEIIQETVYGLMALNEYDRVGYLAEIHGALVHLQNVQLGTGGWKNYYIGGSEDNQITGEALRGIALAIGQPIVPDLSGEPQADANSAIEAAGLVVGTITYEYHDTMPEGLVANQNPVGGTQVPLWSSVDFVLSLGQPIVPYVVDMNEADANSAITAFSLNVGLVTYEYNDVVPTGHVISQDPVGGTTVLVGSAVDLAVSLGQGAVVPDIVGTTEANATSTVAAASLSVGTISHEYSDTVTLGFVIRQSPTSGTMVPIWSTVDFAVSLGQPTVPEVIGMTESNASSAIVDAGLVVGSVTYEYNDTVPVGVVINQNPASGTIALVGSPVDFAVSLGVPITVPDVVNMTEADANSTIVGFGLVVGTLTYVDSDTVPAGLVISQDPVGGTTVPIGSAVDLVVSAVTVPNVVGMTQASASSILATEGLTVGNVSQAFSDTVAAGLVISQSPAATTTAPVGSPVDLVISLGRGVPVPDVTGMSESDANSTLTGDELVVGTVSYEINGTVAAGIVISQNPVSPLMVPVGSAVDLLVSLGPPVIVPYVVEMTKIDANSAITSMSLTTALVFEYSDIIDLGVVMDQNPVAGTIVHAGAPVEIVVSLGQPVSAVVLGGNRLVELQHEDGGWDLPLFDPNSESDSQSFALVAMGLAQAYRQTSDPNMLASLQLAKIFLLSKIDNFVGADGILAAELDGILGGTACVDYVRTNFYDMLQSGTYYDAIGGTVHDTNSFVQAQRDRRFLQGNANLATWDLGLGLYGASMVSASTAEWIAGVKAEIDELNGDGASAVLGLAGGILGLAAVGEDHDPCTGQHAAASSLTDLADILATYQLETGGFTWWWATRVEYLDEVIQETVYSIIAFNELNRANYLAEIHGALVHLQTVQLGTGGWKNYYVGSSENNLVTGGALWGIATAAGEVSVPALVGGTESDANSAIVAAGLVIGATTYHHSDTIPAGVVTSQNPAAGTVVPAGSFVHLGVSSGPSVVPDVVGQAATDANSAIISAGLVIGTIAHEYNDVTPTGYVISQSPFGGITVPVGTPVDLVVSLGQPVVPYVIDLTEADANSAIVTAGLTVGTITYDFSDTVLAGLVISQNPIGGATVPVASTVDLVVSLGQPTEVPDTVGMTKTDANSTITANDLVVTARYEYNDIEAPGVVIDQDPVGGTIVPIGSSVELTVSLGQPIAVLASGGSRLVELQNNDGGWDLPLDEGDPNIGSDASIFAQAVMGLAQVYRQTSDPNVLTALQKAKAFLLSKANNFVVMDGTAAVELDSLLGGTTCADHVRTNFYDMLEAGIYYDAISDAVYDTASYIQAQRYYHFSQGNANLAAWDLGLGLYSAYVIGASTTEWITAVQVEIDELDADGAYDILGLAGAVFGLAAVGQDHDPQAGHYEDASSLSDLAEILAGYQLETGGFTWWWASREEYQDETIQETSYAIMALNKVDGLGYLAEIFDALNHLQNVQLGTGGWKNYYTGSAENNQITGEALWGTAIAVAALRDFDKDSDVDLGDFAMFASAWLTEPGDSKWNPAYDISDWPDGIIDELDLAALTKQWLEDTAP
jgi:beta-lactam-binding protein with PASTA domain/N-glycosylase/DNA lyase